MPGKPLPRTDGARTDGARAGAPVIGPAQDPPAPARRRVRRRRSSVLMYPAVVWLAVVGLSALTASWLPMPDPALPDYGAISAGISPEHWLGTDNLGRDNLSRVIFGARASLLVGVSAVVLGLLVGGGLGVVAGYRRGRFDQVLMVITDSLLAFPGLVFLLALVALLGASLNNLLLALAVLAVPIFIRLARANTLVVAQREYVTAARAYGCRPLRIVLRDIAPNVVLPVAAYGFIMIGIFIVAEGSLSFLGLGIPPPAPSWGSMIAGGRTDLVNAPHVSLVPSAVMLLTVLSINLLGERARKRFDVRDSNL
jgi:peptide/nickel transport system permease protein